jgi:hypothetical protein
MTKPVMEFVKIQLNYQKIKACGSQRNLTSFKEKELYDLKKQTIPDWLLVLVLLSCLSLTCQICRSLYCSLPFSVIK